MAEEGKKTERKNRNIMGAVAYLLGVITGIVIYLIEKKDKYVRFHAVQSMFLCIAETVIAFALIVTIIGVFLLPLLFIIYFVLWIFMMYKAYSGEKYKLPYLGDLAEKYV